MSQMNLVNEIKKINWKKIVLFYGVIMVATYFSRKVPNILNIIIKQFTDLKFSWNFNHAIAILIVSFLFYKYSKVKQEFSVFGNNTFKSILFPVILLLGYTIYGIENDYGFNEHLWALIFCLVTLVYDMMEEYTWRGYLVESLGKINLIIKSVISGFFWAFWHLLIFKDFEQYGGFGVFIIFCVVFSLILTFSVSKTKAFIVPATIHALLIKTNIVTLVCFVIFLVILLTWDRKISKEL